MKKYRVIMPIAGSVFLEVDAKDKESALNNFYEIISTMTNGDIDDCLEWDFYEQIVSGNVCHLYTNEVDISEIK